MSIVLIVKAKSKNNKVVLAAQWTKYSLLAVAKGLKLHSLPYLFVRLLHLLLNFLNALRILVARR